MGGQRSKQKSLALVLSALCVLPSLLTTQGCDKRTRPTVMEDSDDSHRPKLDWSEALFRIDGANVQTKGDRVSLVDLTKVGAADLPLAIAVIVDGEQAEEVRLEGRHVGDPSVLPIAGIQSLQRLRLTNTSISDAVLDKLAFENRLALLHVHQAENVTSTGWNRLAKLTSLKDVSLSGDNIEDFIAEPLGRLPNVKKIRLRGTAIQGMDFGGFAGSPVVDLELAETEFSDAGMGTIAGLKNLSKLNLWLTAVTDDGLEQLADKTQITSLNLDNMAGITDRSMDVVATLSDLTFLHLGKTKVTDVGLNKLHGLKELETIHVTNLTVSEASIGALRQAIPGLKQVIR